MKEREYTETTSEDKKKSLIRETIEYVVWLACVIAAVQVIIHFVGTFSVVDGESMEPTLYNGEYLWVDKLKYHLSEPDRFDVIIFPVNYRGEDTHFVKRIIGLPGETVSIDENGTIIIDGKVLTEYYGKEVIQYYVKGE